MADRTVHVTFQISNWSGWSRDHLPQTYRAEIGAREREALCPQSFDRAAAAKADPRNLWYAVWPVRIWEHKAIFHYDRLVMTPPDGRYTLFGPYEGDFVLRIGQYIRFHTATLDAGTYVFLRLDAIDGMPLGATSGATHLDGR